MARTAKKTAPAPAKVEELIVVVSKTEKAESSINAYTAPVVSAAEIQTADSAQFNLCLNILAGKLDPVITEAHSKRGGLKRLFSTMDNMQANRLRTCLDADRATLAAAWTAYTSTAKKVRTISLSGMVKAFNEFTKEKTTPKVTLRDTLTAWAADNAEFLDNPKKCPASLLEIFIEFDLIGETEAD